MKINKPYKKPNKMMHICMVGSDLTSAGGITSVVQAYHSANLRMNKPLLLTLIKSSYYKDKPKIFELYIFIFALFKYLYFLITNKEVHIIHIHSSFGFSFIRKSIFILLGKSFGKKIILHIHASNFYKFFLSSNYLLSSYCSLIFKYSDLILVLCDDWKDKLEKKYKLRNVKVIHNPVEIKKYDFEKQTKSKYELNIIFLGFLIKSKGILDIIELSKKMLKNKISGVKIIIAGKGDMENMLINAIKDYSLENIVDFKGWIDGNEKKSLLSTGDIFFLPSYKEGMPIAILEAMASGLAIVSTAIAGIPELVEQGRNGYLFKPGDIDGYYNCFIHLKNSKKKITEMSLESKKISRSFDADRIFENLIKIYKSLQFDNG